MTEHEENNTFLRKLISGYKVEIGLQRLMDISDLLNPSNFHYVKSFMEREMPEAWEEYLYSQFEVVDGESNEYILHSEALRNVLDLSNLVAFLSLPESISKWRWERKDYVDKYGADDNEKGYCGLGGK